jgi:hypothetical protein
MIKLIWVILVLDKEERKMILFVILAVIYLVMGMDYANGMVKYITRNNKSGSNKTEETWDSIEAEIKELLEAIYDLSFINVILETADVIHAYIKHIILTYLPIGIYCHWLCWFIVFPFVLPASIKLASRHRKYGCIRNHKNVNNIKHNCDVNDNNRVNVTSVVN